VDEENLAKEAQAATTVATAEDEVNRKDLTFQGAGQQFESALLNKDQMCRVLQVCPATLNNRMRDGSIPFIKLGSRTLFHLPSVEAALLRKQRAAR